MHYVTIDPRDGGAGVSGGSSCSKCCCEPIGLRPGEISQLVLNYAPWSVPIGGRGLVSPVDLSILPNLEACNAQTIDGFGDPNLILAEGATTINIAFALPDMAAAVTPAGNTQTFALAPVSGPYRGTLTAAPSTGVGWIYTPNSMFAGWDSFWIRVTDAQGRSILREQVIRVGTATEAGPKPYIMGKTGLVIDRTKIKVDSRMHRITVPLSLALNASCDTIEGCARYRATLKVQANDCDDLFSHITCFDVYCVKC